MKSPYTIRLSEVQKKAIELIRNGKSKEVAPMTLRALKGKGIIEWDGDGIHLTKLGESL